MRLEVIDITRKNRGGGHTNKLSIYELVFIITTLIYLTPTYLKNIGVIYVFYNNILPLISLCVIAYFILNVKNKGIYLVICFSYFILALSTYLHHGDTFGVLKMSFNGIGYCSIVAYMFDRKNYRNCLKYLIVILEVLVTLNLITVILFPDGLYRIYGFNMGYSNAAYLLGHRNNAVDMIPLIGFCILKDLLDKTNFSRDTIYSLVISLITSVMTWSANALLCIVFEVFAILFIIAKRKFKLFNIWFMFLTSALISTLLIMVRYQERYAELLVNVLHRDVTLSSRSFLWDRALRWIPQSPIIGFGVEAQEIFYPKIGHMSSCHNYFLDYLYQGGIVLLITIVILMLLLTKEHSYLIPEIKARIAVAYGGYMILWIATPIHRDSLFMMYSFFIITSSLCRRKGVFQYDTKSNPLLLVRRKRKTKFGKKMH